MLGIIVTRDELDSIAFSRYGEMDIGAEVPVLPVTRSKINGNKLHPHHNLRL